MHSLPYSYRTRIYSVASSSIAPLWLGHSNAPWHTRSKAKNLISRFIPIESSSRLSTGKTADLIRQCLQACAQAFA